MDQNFSCTDHSFLQSLRARLRECPDTEPEQAMLRVIIGCTVFAYLYLAGAFHGNAGEISKPFELFFLKSFVIFSVALLGVVAIRPVKSVPRRLTGMVVDLGATTYGMLATGPFGAPLYVVFYGSPLAMGFAMGCAMGCAIYTSPPCSALLG